MRKAWDENERSILKNLILEGDKTYYKIAEIMGRSRNSVVGEAGRLGLKNPFYMRSKTKHKHLREPVLKYFLNHSTEECQERFNLTASEFKSLCTVAYKDPNLKHLRKDKRRNDVWSSKELVFFLQHAGLQPRAWIAKKLKRGTKESIKECQFRLKTGSTKYINGIPLKWAKELFNQDFEAVKTNAGPVGCSDFRFVIVPWCVLSTRLQNDPSISQEMKSMLRAMHMFQGWIHGTRRSNEIVESIKKIVRKK